MPRILIVEDDAAVRDMVEYALSREKMETTSVTTGEETLERLWSADRPYDLVVLDVMLPGIDGLAVCREIREQEGLQGRTPVIMLTARDDEMSVVVGLEVGADDYVTKPFSPRVLVSRVRAQLRREQLSSARDGDSRQQVSLADLHIDFPRRQVLVKGKPVKLTAKEFDILALLASHPGRVYNRERIMDHLWSGEFFGEPRAADVHIQHIRGKIEPDPKNPRYIQTLRGAGYRFAEK